MHPEIKVIYRNLCPVCGRDLTWKEIEEKKCFNKNISFREFFEVKESGEFSRYFREKTGFALKSVQKFWAKKLLKGLSFTAVAPTGTGKTLFGLVYALFLAERGKKSYIIVPTTLLLKQSYEKLSGMSQKIRILCYLPGMKRAQKEEFFEKLGKGEFNILLTTAAFLSKNFEKLKHLRFDFVMVDDVDAVLKASKNVERILHLLNFDEEEIKKGWRKEGKKHGQLLVSTATVKIGRKARLFISLLNFSVGSARYNLRNIEEFLVPVSSEEERIKYMLHVLRKLGSGCLVFTQTEEEAVRIEKIFRGGGIECACVISELPKKEIEKRVNEFLEEKLQALIGVCSPYGLLVRGIDYPLKIKYALFFGAPKFKITVKEIEEASPKLLLLLASVFRKNERLEALVPYLLRNEQKREEARKILREIFEKRKFDLAGEDVVVRENAIFIPDVASYIQASGRTSRLFAGGITKGFSVIFDEEDVLKAFELRASYYDLKLVFAEMEKIELERIREELMSSRSELERVQKSGEDIIKPVLFIVESPTKAKQIARFFGKPAAIVKNNMVFYEIATGKYVLVITASLGHVTDLVENEYYHGVMLANSREFVPVYGSIKKCRKDNLQWVQGERCPRCGERAAQDSRERIWKIMEMACMTENVIIATDPDTEGEKIAWDVENFTKMLASVKRAEFHEVTKHAVMQALENLREINYSMVGAQIVRRIEDRWIGFELSKILQNVFKDRNLSAGRAQSPVLKWIIERYHAHRRKIRILFGRFDGAVVELGRAEEVPQKISKTAECEVFVARVREEERERVPLPPYSTDTVLKDLNRILKLSSKQAMRILQELFENGMITYHRTDSVRVSEKGLQIAKMYLKDDFEGRKWEIGKEGAHECIRPTRALDSRTMRDLVYQGIVQVSTKLTRLHFMVYDLIFRRFMASQCKRTRVVEREYEVEIREIGLKKKVSRVISASGRAQVLYPYAIKIEKPLPEGKTNCRIFPVRKSAAELYTQADVVSLMKERNIGRPSTYATIIGKLFTRGYIFERKFKLIPSKRGITIAAFLFEHFESFVSEERTRLVERIMDEIEEGKIDYQEALKEFYGEIMKMKENVRW